MIRLIAYGAILCLFATWLLISNISTPAKITSYPDVAYHFPDSDRWPDVRKGPNRNLKTKDHK